MDRKTIEDHVTDYVEGKCTDAVQDEIDEKRQREPDFDRLIRAHESLLSALRMTPVAAAPNGLSEKILSAIRQKEDRIAEEQIRYRKEMMIRIPLGVLAAAFFYAVYGIVMDGISTAAHPVLSWFDALTGHITVPDQIPRWLNMTGVILDHHMQLPFLSTSLPSYIIVVTAILIGIIWHYHDDRTQIG